MAKNYIEVTLYCAVMLIGVTAMVLLPLRKFKADYLFGTVLIILYLIALTLCFLIGFEVIQLPE